MRILFAEDDERMVIDVGRRLDDAGHEVRVVGDLAAAEALGLAGGFDAVVLDRTFPSGDGLAALRRWRTAGNMVPVLLLTARGDVADRIEGLRAGSDDYLAKPFDIGELLARLDAICRRRREMDGSLLTEGDIRLNLVRREVTRAGIRMRLQPRECGMLAQLISNAGSVVTRSMLLETVWGYGFDPGTNIVESHMSRLRAKLCGAGRDPIETVRGLGYRLCAR